MLRLSFTPFFSSPALKCVYSVVESTGNNWTVCFLCSQSRGPHTNEVSFYTPLKIFSMTETCERLSYRPSLTFPQAVFSLNALESSEHIWNSLSSRLNPDAAVSFRCTADLPGFEMIFCCNMWNFIACLLRSSPILSMLSFDFSFSLSLVLFRCRMLSRCSLVKECQESAAGRILGLQQLGFMS